MILEQYTKWAAIMAVVLVGLFVVLVGSGRLDGKRDEPAPSVMTDAQVVNRGDNVQQSATVVAPDAVKQTAKIKE